MRYIIRFSNRAEKSVKKIPEHIAERILKKIAKLGENPFALPYEKLRGKENIFRIRVGEYRVIFAFMKKEREIYILRIEKREKVYEGL